MFRLSPEHWRWYPLLPKIVITACLFASAAGAGFAQSGPTDATGSPEILDCRTQQWVLTARFMNELYDEGEWQAGGVCYVYTACNCTYYNGAKAGSRTPMYVHQTAPARWEVWWNVSSVTGPFYTSCTSGACAGTGSVMTTGTDTYFEAGYDVFWCG